MTYQLELENGTLPLNAIGQIPSRKAWRMGRRVENVRQYRARLVSDPAFAAQKLLEWLADGRWWSRKALLFSHAIKRAAVLTAAIDRLVSLGKVEVKVERSAKGGPACTLVRLKRRSGNKRARQ